VINFGIHNPDWYLPAKELFCNFLACADGTTQIGEQINLDVENKMKNTMHIQDLWTITKCGCIVRRHVTCLQFDHNIHIIWSVQNFHPMTNHMHSHTYFIK
jgi:hypothetical protein